MHGAPGARPELPRRGLLRPGGRVRRRRGPQRDRRALIAAALAALTAGFAPTRAADTVARGATRLTVAAGVGLVGGGRAVPVAPALTGQVVVTRGVASWLDLGGRYESWLGVAHRLGPELRARALRGAGWSLGAALFPSAGLFGVARGDLLAAGDVATRGALLATARAGAVALTLEAGATLRWLLWETDTAGSRTEAEARLAAGDVALAVEWPSGAAGSLFVRAEVAVALSRGEPMAVQGTFPRVLFGGSFEP